MSKRKNYGSLLIGTSIALGLFSLAGAIIWWQQGMNVLIGSLVFILYGIGQWMTVVYWQRIQADWEATGETLGRLQQAVTDIPAALDANLKSIAERLTEGQAKALAQLQAKVTEGAEATLERGAKQIGDSLARNLVAPLESMKGLLEGSARQNEAQSERLSKLADTAAEEARKSAARGAELIAEGLEKHLKQPLAALEAKLLAWTAHAEAQTESARGLAEETLRAQREGADLSRRQAEGLAQEIKGAAAAQASQADRLIAAWAERATAAQADAEARMAALRDALIEDVTSKLRDAQAAQSEAQERILAKALAGAESQAKAAHEAMAAQAKAAQAAAEAQAEGLLSAAESFTSGLAEIKEVSLALVRDVEAKASAGLEAQSRVGLEVAEKVSELADRMRQGSHDVAELAQAAQINQAEMQAGVAMLNAGLSSILDRLEKQASAGDGYQSLLAELGKTLSDFQERSAEVLVENALKTQEILMEVLRAQEGRAASPSENALASAP